MPKIQNARAVADFLEPERFLRRYYSGDFVRQLKNGVLPFFEPQLDTQEPVPLCGPAPFKIVRTIYKKTCLVAVLRAPDNRLIRVKCRLTLSAGPVVGCVFTSRSLVDLALLQALFLQLIPAFWACFLRSPVVISPGSCRAHKMGMRVDMQADLTESTAFKVLKTNYPVINKPLDEVVMIHGVEHARGGIRLLVQQECFSRAA